jgi:alkylated DNA nucleotide flippase Atl1
VDEGYVEQVLAAVEAIPAGQVATYGDIAAFVGRGGPRQVGQVMSRFGGTVCWWRVVRADGQPARGHESRALAHLMIEGTPLRGERVDLRQARIADDWAGHGAEKEPT